MTATVLDACLCLLLVSAAAVTVASVPTPDVGVDRADSAADTLAATTSFNYTLSPGARRADPELASFDRTHGQAFTRHSRGSLASLLGRAAVRTARIDGELPTHTATDFAAKAHGATRAALPPKTQVVVSWRPYPGAHLGQTVSIGPTPPADADVNAALVRVPSGFAPPERASRIAERSGFGGLSRTIASSLVEGLVPPSQARIALAGDPPVSTLMRYRYRRLAQLYGATVSEPLARGDLHTVNRRLEAHIAARVEADLRSQYDSPTRAARHLGLGTVELSVRTWS